MTDSGPGEPGPIESLKPDPFNPPAMTPGERAALVQSIAEFGFAEPVVVRRSDRLIIDGHRRLRPTHHPCQISDHGLRGPAI